MNDEAPANPYSVNSIIPSENVRPSEPANPARRRFLRNTAVGSLAAATAMVAGSQRVTPEPAVEERKSLSVYEIPFDEGDVTIRKFNLPSSDEEFNGVSLDIEKYVDQSSVSVMPISFSMAIVKPKEDPNDDSIRDHYTMGVSVVTNSAGAQYPQDQYLNHKVYLQRELREKNGLRPTEVVVPLLSKDDLKNFEEMSTAVGEPMIITGEISEEAVLETRIYTTMYGLGRYADGTIGSKWENLTHAVIETPISEELRELKPLSTEEINRVAPGVG